MQSMRQLEKSLDFRQEKLLENMSRILLLSKVLIGVVVWTFLFNIYAMFFMDFHPASCNIYLFLYSLFGLFNLSYFFIIRNRLKQTQGLEKDIVKWEKVVNFYVVLSGIWGVTVSLMDQMEYKHIIICTICMFLCSSLFYIPLKQTIIWNFIYAGVFLTGLSIINLNNINIYSLAYLFFLILFVSFLLSRIVYRAYKYLYLTKVKWQNEMEKNAKLTKQLQLANKQLVKQAYYDELTGVLNRHGFQEFIQNRFESFSKNGATISIILIDIDYFKKFNDYYGHSSGDAVLKTVAQSIEQCAEKSGYITVRWGGEEFFVLAIDLSEEQVNQICKEIKTSIAELSIQHKKSYTSQFLTVSIGASTGYCKNFKDLEDVINDADYALYSVKNKGRNSYCVKPK